MQFSHIFSAPENGQDDHPLPEEEKDDRGRPQEGDVGPRRGRDAQGGQEEEGTRLRRRVSDIRGQISSHFHTSVHYHELCKKIPLFLSCD